MWFAGSFEGNADIHIVSSRLPKGSDRWEPVVDVSNDLHRSEQNPSLFQHPNGEIWALYTAQLDRVEGKDNMQFTSIVRRQTTRDFGRTWEEPVVLFPEEGTFCRQPIQILSNGRWIMGNWICTDSADGLAGDPTAFRISDDEGKTWRRVDMPRSNGRVHANVVELENGKLVAFMRSRAADNIYISHSHDFGETWSEPKPTSLPNNNSGISAVKLQSGRIAITYNPTHAPNADPNGSMATCWYGTMHPELYAAISPWNSPLVSFEEKLLEEGWEMPVFAINGDLDHKMDIPRKSYAKLFETYIRLNGGLPRRAEVPMPWYWKCDAQWNGENRYTSEAGYRQGCRMTTYEYQNLDGYPRFCFTEMKDMPHGAIQDEARAAWAFLSRFSRPLGSKKVVDSGRPELDRNFTQSALPDGREMVVFVPTACNAYTPARSILLFPEAKQVPDPKAVKAWMASSGWIRQANRDGSVLICVTSRFDSWDDVSADIVKELYSLTWGKTVSREYGDILWRPTSAENGKRQGCVWMWETLWHIVGYGDGAVVAGNAAAAHPNHFASVILIGGAPDTFPDREARSDHFLVSKAGKNPDRMKGISADYDVRVADVPSAVWMIGKESRDALDFFLRANSIPKGLAGTDCVLAGEESTLYANPEECAQRVAVTKAAVVPSPERIMADWMGQSVRWKNGPDGTLSTFYWKDQVESGQSPYEKYPFRVPCENRDREYYVYRPKGIGANAPVVITIHGHGEPAWMFLSKNGWPELADREGILVVSPQDNHKNRWYGETDNESFRYLVEDVLRRFDVDPQRIYISGFSNGNMQCYGAAAAHPELFAAMWPMSRAAGAPMFPLEPGVTPDLERLRAHGLEMPMFGVTGDNDGWIAEHPEDPDSSISETVETFLNLAGAKPRKAVQPSPMYWQPDEHRGEAWYRERYGFREADRFDTWVYHNKSGEPRVCVTVMKNMPHGTIREETVAAWDFMKHFRRKSDGTIQMF